MVSSVLSARAIPGNEKAIGRVINHVARRGAHVIQETTKHVHVSGHASEEELKLVITLVKPKYFIPIHGMYRQLRRHAKLAEKTSAVQERVIVAETGDILRFSESSTERVDIAEMTPTTPTRQARRGEPSFFGSDCPGVQEAVGRRLPGRIPALR